MQQTDRRNFLKTLGIAGVATLAGLPAVAFRDTALKKISILHTNDTHSRIDPFPPNDPNYPGMGGYARRAAIINNYRKNDPEILLLDAGDYFQGTPYFNIYGGEVELRLMSKMGYDAATFGNHEFDNGLDGFSQVLPFASFPIVSANYDFSQTIIAGKVKPYIMLHRKGKKIGIYGLGINPRGLVSQALVAETRYLDPLEKARETEAWLHRREGCDLILCLSHLGFSYNDSRPSDVLIARHTRYTDIIIGGHTHLLLDPPELIMNQNNQPVAVTQAGYGGAYMGILDVYFNHNTGEKTVDPYTTKIY